MCDLCVGYFKFRNLFFFNASRVHSIPNFFFVNRCNFVHNNLIFLVSAITVLISFRVVKKNLDKYFVDLGYLFLLVPLLPLLLTGWRCKLFKFRTTFGFLNVEEQVFLYDQFFLCFLCRAQCVNITTCGLDDCGEHGSMEFSGAVH